MNSVFKHLDFCIEQNEKISRYFDGNQELNSAKFLSLNLLERLSNTSCALKVLIQNISEENIAFEFSCGILLRSTILDVFIGINLHKILSDAIAKGITEKEKIQKLNDFSDIILSDGIKHTLEYFKDLKDIGLINEAKLKLDYANVYKENIKFFQEYKFDGTIPKLKSTEFYSPSKLFKTIANQYPNSVILYDVYSYYSKYDHLGKYYNQMSRQDGKVKLDRIKQLIEQFVYFQFVILDVLKSFDNDPFINKQFKKIEKYIIMQIQSEA